MSEITPTGNLSPKEALKSLRDICVVGLAAMVPSILELLPMVDFGEWTPLASFILAGISPFINRWLNVVRVE